MKTTYDLIITHIDSCTDIPLVSKKISKILGSNPSYLEFLLREVSTGHSPSYTILNGTTKNFTTMLQSYLKKHGIKSNIKSELALVPLEKETPTDATYTCPACKYDQKADSDDNNICKRCGVVEKKFNKMKKQREIFESERRYQEARQEMEEKQKERLNQLKNEAYLREKARERLGIKKSKPPILLIGLVTLIAIALLLNNHFYQNEKKSDDKTISLTKKEDKSQKNRTLKLNNIPASSISTIIAKQQSPQANANFTPNTTVATLNNIPDNSDLFSKSLATKITDDLQNNSPLIEKNTKANLIAYSIDDKKLRTDILKKTGGEEVELKTSLRQNMKQNKYSEDINAAETGPLFANIDIQIIKGNYETAYELTKLIKDNYQKAKLLFNIIKTEINIKNITKTDDAKKHILQLAKIIWSEPDAKKQIKIQSLLSMAYSLTNEEKIASLNLIMAIEKMKFIKSNSSKLELFCQLSHDQSSIGNINQAREILHLAEHQLKNLEESQQQKAYANIAKNYAKALDFSTAIMLTSHIQSIKIRNKILVKIEEMKNIFHQMGNSELTTTLL